ncbi:MAG: M48 family metalloprotease [Mariprofundaceae bacterium]|nr:M48 family metalloprotease [Mariprofundaceae bacterium]
MKHMRFNVALVLSFLLFSACATNPVSKKSDFVLMGEKQELALGEKTADEVAKEMALMPASDPLVQYVDKVGQRVAAVSDRPDLIYRFHVVDDTSINAFALPGGYIYINRGLLIHMNSEAELAAVLGHEIGHVTARHAVQRYTQAQSYRLGSMVASILLPIPQGIGQVSDMLASALIQGYGRKAELQSDELSIKYIAKAGYDVRATTRILKTLKRLDELDRKIQKDVTGKKVEQYHGAFASHPETQKRIAEAVAKTSVEQGEFSETGHNTMLAALDGYPYAGTPAQGAMAGRRFLHPDLGIQLTFPDDWTVKNSPQTLTARKRQKKAFFRMQLDDLQKKTDGEAMLRDMFGNRQRLENLRKSQRGPFAVTQAIVNVSLKNVGAARMHATVLIQGTRAFILLSWSQRKFFNDFVADFQAISDSFAAYDPKRDGDIPRIHPYVWKQNDSWQKLARRSHDILGRFTADKLAALSGMGAQEKPAPGALVKIVK